MGEKLKNVMLDIGDADKIKSLLIVSSALVCVKLKGVTPCIEFVSRRPTSGVCLLCRFFWATKNHGTVVLYSSFAIRLCLMNYLVPAQSVPPRS
jgi:hypothetical protein